MNEEKIYPSRVIRSQAKAIEFLEKENTNLKQALNEIRKYIKGAYEMAIYTKNIYLAEENIEDILQIIDKTLGGSDENE